MVKTRKVSTLASHAEIPEVQAGLGDVFPRVQLAYVCYDVYASLFAMVFAIQLAGVEMTIVTWLIMSCSFLSLFWTSAAYASNFKYDGPFASHLCEANANAQALMGSGLLVGFWDELQNRHPQLFVQTTFFNKSVLIAQLCITGMMLTYTLVRHAGARVDPRSMNTSRMLPGVLYTTVVMPFVSPIAILALPLFVPVMAANAVYILIKGDWIGRPFSINGLQYSNGAMETMTVKYPSWIPDKLIWYADENENNNADASKSGAVVAVGGGV